MRYLFYCGPGIGDLLILLPYTKIIKENDPQAYIDLFTVSSRARTVTQQSILVLQEYVERLEYYSAKELLHSIRFVLRLGYKRYDYAFVQQYVDSPQTSVWPVKIAKFAAKHTCGIEITQNKKIKFDIQIPRTEYPSVRKYWEKMLYSVGITWEKIPKDILSTKKLEDMLQEIEFIPKYKTKKVTFCIGAAPVGGKINGKPIENDTKSWPIEHWLILAKRLAEKGINIFLIGGNAEARTLEKYTKDLSEAGIENWTGKTSVAQSIAIINVSDLLVSCDTGMLHAADVVATPMLGLFGCTDPSEYMPHGVRNYYICTREACSPCFGTEAVLLCKEKKCMNNITPEMVYERICKILGYEN